jgi:hypothetical protein
MLPGDSPTFQKLGMGIVQPNLEEGRKAWDALTGKGDYSQWPTGDRVMAGITDAASAAVPFVGPLAHHLTTNVQQGKYGEAGLDAAGIGAAEFGPALVGKLGELIPSTKAAGALFDPVEAAAGKVPIDVSDPGTVASRAKEMFDNGESSLPSVIRKFYNRVNAPGGADVSFQEARDYYSAVASKLSPQDLQNLSPRMAGQLIQFKQALGKALTDAAGTVGKDAEYQAALKAYARASKFEGGMATAKDFAFRKLLPWTAKLAGGGVLTGAAIKEGYDLLK